MIGEVTCRAGEVKETGKRCKIYPCVEMGITILIFSPCCIVALLDISYSFLRIARDWNDIIGVVFKTSSLPCPVALRGVSIRKYRGSAHRARGLEYKQEHNPRFRLYRAAKTQGRRRKKGEDCPSGASSTAPDGDRGDKPKSPITAAALLGSFFSLLRRMNK
mgnify:CR=1 FL=1